MARGRRRLVRDSPLAMDSMVLGGPCQYQILIVAVFPGLMQSSCQLCAAKRRETPCEDVIAPYAIRRNPSMIVENGWLWAATFREWQREFLQSKQVVMEIIQYWYRRVIFRVPVRGESSSRGSLSGSKIVFTVFV